MKRRTVVVALAGLYASVMESTTMFGSWSAVAATPPKPTITEDARAAVAQMGKTLLAKEFSFRARTIRPYANENGVLLHIEHDLKVTVRRPDRLLIDDNGDDGPRKLFYDGKTVVLALDAAGSHYARLPVPDTITMMMYVVMGRFRLDFPLADFLTDAPDKAFLHGVTSGREVNKVTIDGVPCVHLVFSQPPGIELELWLEADRGVPRRLIVIDNDSPGKPELHRRDVRLGLQRASGRCRLCLHSTKWSQGDGFRRSSQRAAHRSSTMNRFIWISLAALIGFAVPLQVFGWGTVTGPRGGTATTGPRGAGYAQGPNGGTAARGPRGAGYAQGPNGAAAVRGPYGGAAAVGPNGGTAYRPPAYGRPVYGRPVYGGPVYAGAVYRPWVAAPYYGAVVAGVALGTVIAAATPPPPPSPALCWFWSSPAHNQGYWDYCSR